MLLKPLQLPAALVAWVTLHHAPVYALWIGSAGCPMF